MKVYQSLARANFSAERGVRYGQDFYDERMQASKVVSAVYSEDGLAEFELVDLNATTTSEAAETKDIEEKLAQTKLGEEEQAHDEEKTADEAGPDKASMPKVVTPSKSRDPLRWFGILSPPSLRQAQSSSSKLVQTAVKLSTVDAEMKGVEIEIRRARKRKVKSENMLVKEETSRGNGENRAKQEAETKPLKVNRGGGCGRVAI